MANAIQRLGKQLVSLFWDHPEPTGVADLTLLNTMAREMDSLFNLSWTRRIRYQDFDKMDRGYMAPVLDAVATACTKYRERPTDTDILGFPRGFKVELVGNYGTSGPRKVIAQVLKDTNIKDRSYDYVRNLVKYGDVFVEILFWQDAVVGLQRYLSQQMWVNKDLKGYYLGPDINGVPQAFQQKELREGTIIAGFEPWQIVHWKFHETEVHAYSEKSLLDDIRDDWWKLSYQEQALVIARLTRAWPRTTHWLDMTNKSEKEQRKELTEFARSMTRRTTRGGDMVHQAHSPDEDMFRTTQYHNLGDNPVPKLDRIEIYDPKLEGLANIEDIRYQRQKLFTRVPAGVIGIQDVQGDQLTAQDIAFLDLVGYTQWRFEVGLRQLFDTALFLKGYTGVEYRITFPHTDVNINWKHADSQFRISAADQNYMVDSVYSRREVLRQKGKTDEQIEAILAEVKREEAELPPLPIKGAVQQAQGSEGAQGG